MADAWDDSDDEWDNDDDEIDARLSKLSLPAKASAGSGAATVPQFDDDEDLAKVEKAKQEQANLTELKKKGNALAAKKQADLDRKIEEEVARKVMEMEAEFEADMDPDELKRLKRQQVEDADNALTDDLFGTVDNRTTPGPAQAVGDRVVMKDLKDHLKHAKKVASCMKVRVMKDRKSFLFGKVTWDF
jgi:translation initiation factor 3 subunit J